MRRNYSNYVYNNNIYFYGNSSKIPRTSTIMYNKYFTKFPNPSELLCLYATINSQENNNTSYYNQIILKCRQLIFEIPEVIACPQIDRIYGIYIVIKEDFYKTGELHSYLEKHSLRCGSAQVVQNCIFEKCCLYTIISKLAPKWNQVSDYLVHGRNFLTNQRTLDSVQMKCKIDDKGNTTININVNQIKLSEISLNNLYLTEDEQKELKTNKYLRFKECNIRSIQVLPSLKRGKIIALHMKLTKKSSIKSYQEMRRYWKNAYGYRLPETDEDIFYVDISFFEGSQIFTYPNLCVRFYEPVFTQRIDSNAIITNFIASLKKYVPIILGENYPVPSLVSSSANNLLTVSQINLPSSSEINTTFKEKTDTKYFTPERVLKDENNILPNDKEPKSKLSQLLAELNKSQNKSTIYLTPKPTCDKNIFNYNESSSYVDNNNEIEKSAIENKNDVQSKSISEDLKKQLDFLTTSISQRTSTEKASSQSKRDFVLFRNESIKVPEKKRKIDSHQNFLN